MARQSKADNVLIAGLPTHLSDALFRKWIHHATNLPSPKNTSKQSTFIVRQRYATVIEEVVNSNKTNLKKRARITLVEGFPENLEGVLEYRT